MSEPGIEVGPVNASALFALASAGKLTVHDLLRDATGGDWFYVSKSGRLVELIEQANRTCGGRENTTAGDTSLSSGDLPEELRWADTVIDDEPMDVDIQLPSAIGPFKIKGIIGAGGMGMVLLGEQAEPRREVAVKIMRAGLLSPRSLRRFEFESEVLSRLQHAGIAHVYKSGVHDEGTGPVPYFAMEYITDARTLIWYAREEQLARNERLALFLKVCDAVHYGHVKGIVHRDLKPGNILVDEIGQPKVIDFGVARSTDENMSMASLQTDVGQLVGTMQYMSPEQCSIDTSDIDARTDVYSLGVILFELLAGRLPYDVRHMPIPAAVRVVQEQPPVKLSSFGRKYDSALEAIVHKALQKERAERYQSVEAIALDISGFLAGSAIAAELPAWTVRFGRFLRRNRAASFGVSAVACVLVIAVAISLWLSNAVEREQANAKFAQTQTDEALDQNAKRTKVHSAELATLKDEIGELNKEIAENKYVLLIVKAKHAYDKGDVDELAELLSKAKAQLGRSRWQMPFEWQYMRANASNPSRPSRIISTPSPVTALACSADGRHCVSGDDNGGVRVWNLASCSSVVALANAGAKVVKIAFKDDGTELVSLSQDMTLRRWECDPATGVPIAPPLAHFRLPECIPASMAVHLGDPAYAAVATGNYIRLFSVIRADSKLALLQGHDGSGGAIAISHDGKTVASGFGLSEGIKSGKLHGRFVPWNSPVGASCTAIAFSLDDRSVAIGDDHGNVHIHDVPTKERVGLLSVGASAVASLQFNALGNRLITTSSEGRVAIWDARSWQQVLDIRGDSQSTGPVLMGPEDGFIAVGFSGSNEIGSAGGMQIWRVLDH